MKLSQKAIEDFKHRYFKLYGEYLTDEQAIVKGFNLLRFYLLIDYKFKQKKK